MLGAKSLESKFFHNFGYQLNRHVILVDFDNRGNFGVRHPNFPHLHCDSLYSEKKRQMQSALQNMLLLFQPLNW